MAHYKYSYIIAMVALSMATNAAAQSASVPTLVQGKPVRVGMAWQRVQSNYDRVARSIELAGGIPVMLPQMQPQGFDYDSTEIQSKYLDENGILLQPYADVIKLNTYYGCNTINTIDSVDAVVLLGGCDISPTLFANPEPWHGIEEERNYDTSRDLSEYLTVTYCLDHDIPVLGLCRGMQMLTVASGAPLIQDIGAYYASLGKEDHFIHRSNRDEEGKRHYTPHDVVIIEPQSMLHAITGADTIHNVPSWHHQAAGDLSGTNLIATAITAYNGINIIEAVERTDKPFAVGVQFHPEEAVRMHLDGEEQAERFMPLDKATEYFKALVVCARMVRDMKKQL